jgi:hypothetical protein
VAATVSAAVMIAAAALAAVVLRHDGRRHRHEAMQPA